MVKDLTTGKVSKQLWLFALPLLGSVIFQQLYNMADTIIAGKFIGEDALAAVGASYPITMLFMAIALGSNLGCSVIISRLFGEKKITEVKEGISTITISVIILGILLSLLGIFLGNYLLTLVNTPLNIFKDSLDYFVVYMGGFLFVLLYNVTTGIFSALGDSKTPLYFLIASSLGNIVLDIVFVVSFKMGVIGLALATLIAQGIAAIFCVITLFYRLRSLHCNEKPKIFSKGLLIAMCLVAVPSVLQQSFISIGNMIIQGIVNDYGSSIVAGFTAAIKLNTFVLTCITTVGGALSNFTAQNLGAKNVKRVKQGANASIIMMLFIVLPFTLFYLIFPNTALLIFMDEASEVAMDVGRNFLYAVSPFYIVIAIKLMYDAILRGSANMKTFMVATFVDLFLRVILCFILNDSIGLEGIWWSWPIGWFIAMLVSAYFYFNNRWYAKYIN
ncbi:MAG: MATE family efflux transporter [Bacilli bacterium]|nr:MATE family efflux transporter [Bacilli bacterium]